ncbi:hypothetical protein ACFW81_06650 [Streptomyces angustmyceticus]|uniref:hypothetical protein n=1 Tax=Streptomyces angustmyceticus TaxID=285578 RepID=UPI00367A4C71
MGRLPSNKYAAVCAAGHCTVYVQAGAGVCIRQEGRWQVYCPADAPQEGGAAAVQPPDAATAGSAANRFVGPCTECSVQVEAGAGVLVPDEDGKRGVQCPVCQAVAFRHERWDESDQFGTDPWITDAVPPGCAATISLRILALNRECWKCKESTACVVGLYPSRPARTDRWARWVGKDERAWIKPLLAGARFERIAESIKLRWSSTVEGRYLSNGCQRCDALQGDFPVEEEASDLVREDGVDALDTLLVAQVPTPVWQRVVHGERGSGNALLM